METITGVTLAGLIYGNRNHAPLTPLAAAYISEYRPRYVVLSKHPTFARLEIVITSDSLGDVLAWMRRHDGSDHLAFCIK